MATAKKNISSIGTSKMFQLENLNQIDLNFTALLIAICILITVYTQKLVQLVNVSLSEHLILKILIIPIALVVLYLPFQNWFTSYCTPRDIIAIVLPMRVLSSVFGADLHLLPQLQLQLIMLNTVGVAVFVLIFGITMSSACLREINWDYIVCYSMAMVSMDCHILIKALKTMDIPNTVLAILITECISTFGNSMIINDIYMGYLDGTVSTWYHMIFIAIRMSSFGLLIGCVVSKICTLLINPLLHNHEYLILTWIIIAYQMYNICEGLLYCSGTFAVLTYAIFMSTEKNRVAMSAFHKMEFIIDSWHFIVTTYAFTFTFGNSTMFMIQYFDVKFIFLALCAFIFRIFARCMVVLCMYPFMFRGKKNKANAILVMIFSRRGVLEMNKVRILLLNPMTHVMIEETHSVSLIMILLEVAFNNTAVQLFFTNFGTYSVSAARKTNIANCLDLLETTRVTCMHMFQMNKQYGDANWKLINSATDLSRVMEKVDGASQVKKSYGFKPSCVECQAYTGLLLTKYEIIEKLKELRVMILRTQRISFIRQRERGLIQKSDLKALFSSLDVTAISENIHIDIPELSILYKKSILQNLKELLIKISEDIKLTKPHTHTKFMRLLAKVLPHPAYEIIIYLFIINHTFVFYYNIFASCTQRLIYLISYSVFVLDAILRTYLYILDKTNVRQYFNDIWNQFDAWMLFVDTITFILIIFRLGCETFSIYGYVIILGVTFVGQLRLLKIIKLFFRLYKFIIIYCDHKIEDRILIGYGRALSILMSYHEVLHILPTLIDNVELRRTMEKEIVKEKAIILAQLNNVQHKFTRVAVSSKTKRIINTSVSTMRETIAALKLMGLTDENENLELINRLDKVRKPISKISYAEINSASQIIKWLPFFESMQGFDHLFNAARAMEFQPNEFILCKGKLSGGIYVIIEGMAAMKLTADPKVRLRMKQYGALPIKDYLCDVDYYHSSVHYLISGNGIGILSFLTNRPCDFDVRAVVKTKVVFLNAAALHEAILMNGDPVHGMFSRLWKYVAVNLALSIMWRVPMYRNLRVEETYYYMEKSFVPNIVGRKSIYISDDVEDLILIEGRIRDKITYKIYVGPCYVPRSVRKVQFIRNPKLVIEPQLFIIPIRPELHQRIYENMNIFRRIPTFAPRPSIHTTEHHHEEGAKLRKQSRRYEIEDTKGLISHTLSKNTNLSENQSLTDDEKKQDSSKF